MNDFTKTWTILFFGNCIKNSEKLINLQYFILFMNTFQIILYFSILIPFF